MFLAWLDQDPPVPGFTFSFFAIASSLTFERTFLSTSSSISTSSFSFDALELGAPLLVFLDENESFDCFAGGFGALGVPKNLLFAANYVSKKSKATTCVREHARNISLRVFYIPKSGLLGRHLAKRPNEWIPCYSRNDSDKSSGSHNC